MKKLIISEEEKSSILKMHLSEQVKHAGVAAKNKPFSIKDLIGKVVNFYYDKENKEPYVFGSKIISAYVQSGRPVIQLDNFGSNEKLTYKCDTKNFSATQQNYHTYNTPLSNLLYNQFCTKSTGGEVVPKVDFSSLDFDNTSDFA